MIWTYFIRCGSSGPIKIGKTTNLPQRIRTFRTIVPEALLLGAIEGDREDEVHRRFDRFRIDRKRELFKPEPELVSWIVTNDVGMEIKLKLSLEDRSAIAKKQAEGWSDSARARISAARKKAMDDPEVRARRSAAMKKALADPEFRARITAGMKKALADPEARARISAARKKVWANPESRARIMAGIKKAWADPELRARVSAARKKAMDDPEVRARRSAALRRIGQLKRRGRRDNRTLPLFT